jgi:hypothetical protein
MTSPGGESRLVDARMGSLAEQRSHSVDVVVYEPKLLARGGSPS